VRRRSLLPAYAGINGLPRTATDHLPRPARRILFFCRAGLRTSLVLTKMKPNVTQAYSGAWHSLNFGCAISKPYLLSIESQANSNPLAGGL
jgi:hypothetical protein